MTLWDVSSGKVITAWRRHPVFLCSLAFSPDGQTLASGGDDRVVFLWEAGPSQARK